MAKTTELTKSSKQSQNVEKLAAGEVESHRVFCPGDSNKTSGAIRNSEHQLQRGCTRNVL